ncbi:MAG: bifunctional phosphopantothenoylcysteine decarboxylase/phosphopantothenate--cysteine ligase CoaBC [Bacteroidales bacterium]|nr:bifunctional phosphopantothenoylcysteine decarboxylase/phosphopantothenate--cysteine ligase CoaBC [Bacteroidales bacterium]
MWKGKRILLGISGGIAAYKTPELIRLFVKAGAEVQVVVTKNALEFVTRLTLETVSKNKIYVDPYEEVNSYSTEHIALNDWADLFLIAPATANVLGKFAGGIADDALSTTFLAFNKPVFVAPAMNCKMYEHPSVQKNMQFLREAGVHFMEPAVGELACGDIGKGRMEEPAVIFKMLSDFISERQPWSGKKIMITAGPTYEKIDPVRFIGNYSSGKMGFALAEACAERGAEVLLIAGPVVLTAQHSNIKRVDVESAAQMFEAATSCFAEMDAAILCAAVADFSPAKVSDHKTKRGEDELHLDLQPTKDIAAALGESKKEGQVLVGFALETDQEEQNARLKLERKNLDFIVLNSLNDVGAGFRHDTNKVTILNREGYEFSSPLKSKKEVAEDILNVLSDYLISNS